MAVTITAANLRAIASGAAPEIVDGIVRHQGLLPRYGVDTPNRVAHFLAQCATETAGFTRLEENLFYTSAKRLRQVWPSRFKTDAAAAPFLRNPEGLANSVYASRLGNGPPSSGDGWKYRGSGCKQTTGRTNFAAVERATGLPVVAKPEMLRRFSEALESACIYWRDNRLNRFADAGDVAGLTKAIQGGSGGLADRRVYTDRALKVRWGTMADEAILSTHPILRRGASGDAVRRAQLLLAEHARLSDIACDPGLIDGKFGPGTDNAVRAFQEAKGLMRDGVIGPATWAALQATEMAASAKEPDPSPSMPPDVPAGPEPSEPAERGFWDRLILAILEAFTRR